MSDRDEYVLRTGRERRGPRDGNDRTARIARWLATSRPKLVETLQLEAVAGGEELEIVATWEREDVDVELAHEINRLIEDTANDKGATISATLVWLRKDGTRALSKSFRATCSLEDEEVVRPLDATNASIISQLQRHTEVFAQQVASMARQQAEVSQRQDDRWERVVGIMETTIQTLTRQKADLEQVAEAARAEADQAIELADQAASEAERAAAAAAAAGERDQLSNIVEIGIKQLTGGK